MHDRGLAARDPLTGRSVSALCIAKYPDPAVRDELVTLAHFSCGAVRRLRAEGPCALKCVLVRDVILTVSLMVGCVVCISLTMPMLNVMDMSWLPTLACILAGIDTTCIFVAVQRLRLLPQIQAGISPRAIELFLAKDGEWEGGDAEAGAEQGSLEHATAHSADEATL